MYVLIGTIVLGLFALPLINRYLPVRGQIVLSGFDGVGILIAFGVTSLIAAGTSPVISLTFATAAIFSEGAAALGYRLLGHRQARVRLIPIPFLAPPRSDRPASSALEACFIALYPPALTLIPVVISLLLSYMFADIMPPLSDTFRALALMLGAFNILHLIPLTPFPSGMIIQSVSDVFWPRTQTTVTLALILIFASAAWLLRSVALGVLALAGVQHLLPRIPTPARAPLNTRQALLVLAAYAAMLATHFVGGYLLLNTLI